MSRIRSRLQDLLPTKHRQLRRHVPAQGRAYRLREGESRWTGEEPMARIVGPTGSPTERFQPMKAGCSDFSAYGKNLR
jgi:hypothetical protein